MVQYPLIRLGPARGPRGWAIEEFAAAAGVHPELVRRFVALGLLAPETDAAGRMWFAATQLATVGRIVRLRSGLGLNYAALGLVLDLLARIEELEAQLRAQGRSVRPAARTATSDASPPGSTDNDDRTARR